jgi:hypothetical protein
MELRHLRYFLAVAEELHFSRAAARLRIAQPPLSQQIRQLERELDVLLFHRTNRRRLTPAGLPFLDEVRRVLAQTEHAVSTAQRADRGEIRRSSPSASCRPPTSTSCRVLGVWAHAFLPSRSACIAAATERSDRGATRRAHRDPASYASRRGERPHRRGPSSADWWRSCPPSPAGAALTVRCRAAEAID